jgi:hypothetical protein
MAHGIMNELIVTFREGRGTSTTPLAGQEDDRFARGVKEEIDRKGKQVNVDPFPS